MNDLINDEQFASLFKESIASDYKDALLFMNVDPDISLMKFRKILESLCLQYKEHNNYDFDSDKLYEQIDELAESNIIHGINRESFHEVRMLTNPGVHITNDKANENIDVITKEELIKSVIESRKGVLNLLEHAFLGLSIGKKLPDYEIKMAGGQEFKNLWFSSLSSSDYNDFFPLGELYQELAECYESLIQKDNSYVTRSNSMFVFSAESYKNAFQLCSGKTIDDVISYQREKISIHPDSYGSLFNYALLCLKGKVFEHSSIEAKIILRALITREYTDAYSYLGWQSYIDEDFKSAHKYLTHKKATKNIFTFHKLGVLYTEGKACSVDINAAINYFEKAADLGDADSMFELGKLYHSTREGLQDDERAQTYLAKAVSMGNVDAAIYFDDHYLKLRKTFIDVTEMILANLTKEYQKTKEIPYKTVNKEGRNDLCSCGSGKKYKRCHGVER